MANDPQVDAEDERALMAEINGLLEAFYREIAQDQVDVLRHQDEGGQG